MSELIEPVDFADFGSMTPIRQIVIHIAKVDNTLWIRERVESNKEKAGGLVATRSDEGRGKNTRIGMKMNVEQFRMDNLDRIL